MEPIIKFNVRNQNISRIDNFYVVAKSKRYLTAEFSFLTPEWQGVTKTAIFHDKDVPYKQILTDDKCEVPWEWLVNAGTKQVSVFGGDLITVNMADVTVYESGYKDGETPEPPTPDVYTQIITMIQNIESGDVSEEQIEKAVEKYLSEHPVETLTEEDVQQVVSTYVTEHKEELKGVPGAPGDDGATPTINDEGYWCINGESTGVKAEGKDGDPGEPGYTPVKGRDYWTADDIAEMQSYIDSQIGGALNESY